MPPAPPSCLRLYYFCLRQFRERTNNIADWLITLLAHYYRYQLPSYFYFILLFKGLLAAPRKSQYPTQDSDGKDKYHYKYIFGRDQSCTVTVVVDYTLWYMKSH